MDSILLENNIYFCFLFFFFDDLLELDSSFLLVDTVDSHFEDITDLCNIIHVGNSFLDTEFRYMHHTFFSLGEFNNSTYCIKNLDNWCMEYITNLNFLDQRKDKFIRLLTIFL